MRPPLCTPPAASPSDTRKCADFRASTLRKPISFRVVSVQKSEHFWTLAGEAAQGFLKGWRCTQWIGISMIAGGNHTILLCLFGMSP